MRLLTIAAAALVLGTPAAAQLAPPNALGVTYAHVHLNVTDVAAHEELWSQVFDGQIVAKGSLRTVRLPNMLVVFTEREPTGPSQGTVMDHFGFKVRDIDEILAAWRARGLEVQSEFNGAEGFRNAYLIAPDGIRLELQEDPQLPMKATGYHIHFWTPQYQELMAWYADFFGAEISPRGTIQTTANVPGMNLSFADCRTECVATRGRAIDHIGFEIDGLEQYITRMQARGIDFQMGYREVPSIGLAISFFTDPSGVYVELTEGFDEY
ncbi:MAG: VOC family protein [Gemmatimonadota bacterium]|nr:VOC family protein [Gemmatimonadota bacterium]